MNTKQVKFTIERIYTEGDDTSQLNTAIIGTGNDVIEMLIAVAVCKPELIPVYKKSAEIAGEMVRKIEAGEINPNEFLHSIEIRDGKN